MSCTVTEQVIKVYQSQTRLVWLSVRQIPLVGYCGRIPCVQRMNEILLQYPTMGICLTDSHATWFGFYPMMAIYWIKWASCHLQPCALFLYSSCTTYTKMCRLLLINKSSVTSYHIRAYLWCHDVDCLLVVLPWHLLTFYHH